MLGLQETLKENVNAPERAACKKDFFCAYQAGTLHFEKRERLIGSEKVKM